MNMTEETKEYIVKLAKFLCDNDKTMSFQQLIEHLQFNKIKDYDKPRGIARGISTFYKELVANNKQDEANQLATCIVGQDGEHPWDTDQ